MYTHTNFPVFCVDCQVNDGIQQGSCFQNEYSPRIGPVPTVVRSFAKELVYLSFAEHLSKHGKLKLTNQTISRPTNSSCIMEFDLRPRLQTKASAECTSCCLICLSETTTVK